MQWHVIQYRFEKSFTALPIGATGNRFGRNRIPIASRLIMEREQWNRLARTFKLGCRSAT
jgi:hypothetical protein